MNNENLENIILALLFSAEEPLSLRKLAAILDDASASDIKNAVEHWSQKFDDEAWSIALEKVAGGYQLSSRSRYAPYIARLYSGRRKLRLSKAAMETLAIISYKQPITRAEVENIRGVGCGGVIGNLLERSLIRITGKAKVLGAPFLYGTTQEFLEYLGLNSLKDLPSLEELEAILEREERAGAEADNGETEPAPESEEPAIESAATTESAPSAAVVGPDIEEPYHRPIGSQEDRASDTGGSSVDEEPDCEGEERLPARKIGESDE